MFTTEEADSTVQALLARAYWADYEKTSYAVVAKLARQLSAQARRQAAADIVEMTFASGEATEAQLAALGALMAHSPAEEMTAHAAAYASMIHAGQVDKLGKPYIEHLQAVADAVPACNHLAVQVAWLHDSLEDTDAIPQVIEMLIGEEGLAAVKAITHHPHEPRIDYYRRVKLNPTALLVKRADIAHNANPERLAPLDEPTRDRLVNKYAVALEALAS